MVVGENDRSWTVGEKVCAFIERFLFVPEGKLIGKPIRLEPFQRKFILDVYDNPHGTREAILSIARKNGKTALIACLALAHICGPVAIQNSQVVSGAQSRDQAAIVFKYASKIVAMSPKIAERVRVVPSVKMIVGIQKNVEYQALSAEAKTKHGLSPVVVILDELGQVKGPTNDFVDALETAQGAYDNPLRIIISTQAAEDGDMLSVKIDDVLNSEKPDPHTIVHLYAAPPLIDPRTKRPRPRPLGDPEAIEAANPALGVFRSRADVEDLIERARRMPSLENRTRNLILNERVNTVSPFISPSVWAENAEAPASLQEIAARRWRVYGGLDLSKSVDLTAMVLAAVDPERRLHWITVAWTPGEGLKERAKRDKKPYNQWVEAGFLRVIPGKVVSFERVLRDIVEITAPLNLVSIHADRWRLDIFEAAAREADISLPISPFGQGFKDMAPALDRVEELLIEGRVLHGDHPVLSAAAASAVVVQDPAGNRKLDKSKSFSRIDALAAAVMATAGAEAALKAPTPKLEALV